MIAETDIKEGIRRRIIEAGAAAVGFAHAEDVPPELTAALSEWIGEGRHAGMDFLRRHIELRRSAESVLPGVKTVISMAFSFVPPKKRETSLCGISCYAYGEDYHDVIRRRLKPLIDDFKASVGGSWRICVDSAPLEERYWAMKAGIGKRGRNGAVIVENCGSMAFLAEILTSVELPPDASSERVCEGCGRCLTACPTGALCADGTVDARRCISYLTIEKKGEWEEDEARVMASPGASSALFGCDACITACPSGRSLPPSPVAEFHASPLMLKITEEDFIDMAPGKFKELFASSPVSRASAAGMWRNAENVKKSKSEGVFFSNLEN